MNSRPAACNNKNLTRRRRFTSCPLSMPAPFDEKLEAWMIRLLTNHQPYR
jgi:hypothetical protein